jgi:ribonuclease P protein component
LHGPTPGASSVLLVPTASVVVVTGACGLAPDRGGMGEAHVPTEQPPSGEEARVPAPDVDPRRPGRPQVAARQGPSASLGLIWRLRDRESFRRIRAEGSRFNHGELWMVWVADGAALPPRVGFAIGRAVGTAVDRNRVRRRLRALIASRAALGRFPAGLYLIGAKPAAVSASFSSLGADLDRLLALAARKAAR